jgi:hypothetical protein
MPVTHQLDNIYAIRLLDRALEPKVKVRALEPSNRNPESPSLVELVGPAKQSQCLQLLPWGTLTARRKSCGVVWIIREATPGLRQTLRVRGENFVDLAGAVRVALPHLFVDRTDLEPMQPPTSPKRLADPFADRSSGVARVMLSERSTRRWGVRELATQAGIDPARASRVVRALNDLGLVRFERTGRSANVWVESPETLLDKWTGVYNWSQNLALSVHAPIGDPQRFIPRLQAVLGSKRWALTLQAGAAQIAPHSSWERVHVYIDVANDDGLSVIAAQAGWIAGTEGKLVLMKPYYRTSTWQAMRKIGDVPIVSDLQLVLDLWHYPLRGREQAEHIRDRILRPVWDGGSR